VLKSSSIIDDPYRGWPPVKQYPGGYVDLEFSPFLLADELIMDSTRFMQMKREPPPGLERVVESLKTLHDEGFLRLVDYKSLLLPRREMILAATQSKVKNPDDFKDAIRGSIGAWESVSETWAKVSGRSDDLQALVSAGLLQALAVDGKPTTPENIKELRRILNKKGKLSRGETQLFGEMGRPYLEQTHMNIALFKSLGAPIIDWASVGPMYNAVLYSNIDENPELERQIPKIRELFSFGLDQFEPTNVTQFLAVSRDERTKDLRRLIADATKNKEVFDTQLLQKLFTRLAESYGKMVRGGTRLNVISAAVGLTASIFDGGVTASLLTAGVSLAGQEIASSHMSSIEQRDIKWLLCLVDAKQRFGTNAQRGA
jgi:hypothetical protein